MTQRTGHPLQECRINALIADNSRNPAHALRLAASASD
jgi:hypothetical protein